MNIQTLLHKKIFEVTLPENQSAFLNHKELSVLNIDFGHADIREILIEGALIELKRFKGEGNLSIALAIRKVSDEVTLKEIEDIDFINKKIFVRGKEIEIVPIYISDLKIPGQKPESEIEQKPEVDFATVGLKLQQLFHDTTSFIKQRVKETDYRTSLYERFTDFTQKIAEQIDETEEESKSFFLRNDYLSITDHSFALEPTFDFQIETDISKIVKPRDTSAFWFQTDLSFKSVDEFWHQLCTYYTTAPKDVEYKIRDIYDTGKLPVFTSFETERAATKCFFVNKLEDKISILTEKNTFLKNQIDELEREIISAGDNPDSSPEYLVKVQQNIELSKSLQFAKTNLENFQRKIDRFIKGDSHTKFYVHVFGRQSLISKYDDLIGQKLLHLNKQINDISFAHKELEKTLVLKIQQIHEARKAKAKLQFLENETEASEIIARQKKAKYLVEREQKKKILDEIGQLHENADLVQESIDDEYRRINYFLDNLKTIEDLGNYEERLFQLKSRQQELDYKKEQFQLYLHELRLRVKQIEEGVIAFVSDISDVVSMFQTEIAGIYLENKKLLSFSTQKLWNDWSTKGIDLINKIFEKKTTLIEDFSEIAYLQIQKLYRNQEESLIRAQSRQKEWDNVYHEIQSEFKSLGYYLDPPKITKMDYAYIKELNTKTLRLSTDTKKVLNYQPNFNISTTGNSLLGLSPKITDDSAFFVIDQVWPYLTKEQEKRALEKLEIENRQLELENDAKKMEFLKKKIYDNLNAQKHQFQKLKLINFFPSDVDEGIVKEKSSLFERYMLHSWKESNYTSSHAFGEFKENIFNLAKSLLTLKSVNIVNTEIKMSDTGLIEGDDNTEIFTDRDYFIKVKDLRFSDAQVEPDIFLDDTDDFDIENDNYLELIDSLNDLSEENVYETNKSPVPPTLEEWAQISIKKFREKKKIVELETIQNKLLLLEDEIDKITILQEENIGTFNVELSKQRYLSNEIDSDTAKMQQFFVNKEHELNSIIAYIQKEVDDTVSETPIE